MSTYVVSVHVCVCVRALLYVCACVYVVVVVVVVVVVGVVVVVVVVVVVAAWHRAGRCANGIGAVLLSHTFRTSHTWNPVSCTRESR